MLSLSLFQLSTSLIWPISGRISHINSFPIPLNYFAQLVAIQRVVIRHQQLFNLTSPLEFQIVISLLSSHFSRQTWCQTTSFFTSFLIVPNLLLNLWRVIIQFMAFEEFFDQMVTIHETPPLDMCSIRHKLQNKVYFGYISVKLSAPHLESNPDPWHTLRGLTREGPGGLWEQINKLNIPPDLIWRVNSKYDICFLIWLTAKKSIFDNFNLTAQILFWKSRIAMDWWETPRALLRGRNSITFSILVFELVQIRIYVFEISWFKILFL